MGLFASLLSAGFAAAKDLVSKRLAYRLDGTASTFASFAFALPFYVLVLAVLALLGEETFTWSLAFFGLVVLRSTTDTLAEWMKMHALGHGDISLVASFLSLSPLFLLVLSPIITGDRPSVAGVVAVILVAGGSLLLVYRPSHESWAAQRRGALLGAGASLFFSLNSCFDRLAVQRGTPVFAGFTMTLLSAAFLFPLIARRKDRLDALRAHQGGLWLRGLLEIAFMVSKLYALQYLQAPYVAGIQRLSLVLSIVGGRVFFKEQDFGRRLAAGVLILGGVFLIAWLERP
jgi:drug/metabolite transporter (DMT)-like permease